MTRSGLCLVAATSLFYAPAAGLSRDGSPEAEGKASVSDIFQEVDEEVRREQLKKLWERYGIFLIAACVLLVVAVGGWRDLRMVGGQEGRRGRHRLPGRGRAGRRRQEQGGRGGLRQAGRRAARRAIACSPSSARRPRWRAATRTRRSRSTTSLPPTAASAGCCRILRRSAPARILVDTAPYSEIAQRLEPLTASGPDVPPQRPQHARARRPGAPRIRPRCASGPT